jgi:hypothetical protein
MPAGTPLANFTDAIRSSGRRHLAACGRPLAVAAVLAIGATLFTSVAALLGHRQPTAVFYAAAEGGNLDALAGGPSPMPLHTPSALHETALDTTIASLKGGSFGITFDRQAVDALVAEADALPAGGELAAAAARPTVLVDAALPPLRVDIMGFGTAHGTLREPGWRHDAAGVADP